MCRRHVATAARSCPPAARATQPWSACSLRAAGLLQTCSAGPLQQLQRGNEGRQLLCQISCDGHGIISPQSKPQLRTPIPTSSPALQLCHRLCQLAVGQALGAGVNAIAGQLLSQLRLQLALWGGQQAGTPRAGGKTPAHANMALVDARPVTATHSSSPPSLPTQPGWSLACRSPRSARKLPSE